MVSRTALRDEQQHAATATDSAAVRGLSSLPQLRSDSSTTSSHHYRSTSLAATHTRHTDSFHTAKLIPHSPSNTITPHHHPISTTSHPPHPLPSLRSLTLFITSVITLNHIPSPSPPPAHSTYSTLPTHSTTLNSHSAFSYATHVTSCFHISLPHDEWFTTVSRGGGSGGDLSVKRPLQCEWCSSRSWPAGVVVQREPVGVQPEPVVGTGWRDWPDPFAVDTPYYGSGQVSGGVVYNPVRNLWHVASLVR